MYDTTQNVVSTTFRWWRPVYGVCSSHVPHGVVRRPPVPAAAPGNPRSAPSRTHQVRRPSGGRTPPGGTAHARSAAKRTGPLRRHPENSVPHTAAPRPTRRPSGTDWRPSSDAPTPALRAGPPAGPPERPTAEGGPAPEG